MTTPTLSDPSSEGGLLLALHQVVQQLVPPQGQVGQLGVYVVVGGSRLEDPVTGNIPEV